ncbi:hypothetical protein TruAng_011503 [Truncatella angustata]|nr:hypothetical protein TruAng_011503 [Truncatella angustata]
MTDDVSARPETPNQTTREKLDRQIQAVRLEEARSECLSFDAVDRNLSDHTRSNAQSKITPLFFFEWILPKDDENSATSS